MKKHLRSIMLLGLAALLMTAAAAAGVPAADCECEPCGEWQSLPLYAGQDWEVGEVLVNNCEGKIAVQYVLFDDVAAEGWGLTEVHLSIGDALADIPQNKGKNPVPGNFAINEQLEGVAASEVYCFEMDGREAGDNVIVAAHAVVEKTEVTVLQEAPYGGSRVAASTRGLQKSGAPVLPARSVPETALTWDTARAESDFFSLGFGGEITIEFDCCVTNGDGPDVLLVEDTGGAYPAETAEVYASADGIEWLLLGTADNTTRDATNDWQTVAQFELGELACAKYIKVVDTTDSAPLPANADGYDLNAVVALHDCTETTVYSETAWGGVMPFEGANWATYGVYAIQECVPSLEGQWLLSVNGGAYQHDMVIVDVDASGAITGTGGYPASADPYQTTWSLTGQLTGSSVQMTIVYAGPYNAGYTTTLTGTVAADWLSMAGTGTAGVSSWTATRAD